MKKLFVTLFAIFGLLSGAIAQNAVKDLNITGKYHINKVVLTGKFYLWASISNVSKSDYKDIVYRLEFLAEDGTSEGTKDLTLHDYVGPGTTKKIKMQYLPCPKDCKSVLLSIVSGDKLD